jgi:hypothetical protein
VPAVDGYRAAEIASTSVRYTGIGRGIGTPSGALVDAVAAGAEAIERGLANEAALLVEQIDGRLRTQGAGRVDPDELRRLLAAADPAGAVAEPGPVARVPAVDGFRSRLVACATAAWG